MNDQEFVSIGFIIIQSSPKKPFMHESVCNPVFTPTRCVCFLHPQNEALTWDDKNSEYLENLNLNKDSLEEYRRQVDDLLTNERWGFDSVISDIDSAVGFYKRWFSERDDVRLFEMAIPKEFCEDFQLTVSPPTDNSAPSGVWLAIKASKKPNFKNYIGFEVIGYEGWSTRHTSVCYETREGFVKGLQITFNDLGLFNTLQDAKAAAQMNNNAEGGSVGDVCWYPIRFAVM
ncbi:hypothetical protein [Deinococcus ruber]|uniref:Uncharacterized protein n=1 Tax=Deinococcus ruber TaxID=1848197 RepID=A0A918FBS7_9DEIO|nr:hypothetical protein [Deinococcus ruber]GGR24902.1 hypothetical protein GCM10008957_40710 [Deinococcus ruber]